MPLLNFTSHQTPQNPSCTYVFVVQYLNRKGFKAQSFLLANGCHVRTGHAERVWYFAIRHSFQDHPFASLRLCVKLPSGNGFEQVVERYFLMPERPYPHLFVDAATQALHGCHRNRAGFWSACNRTTPPCRFFPRFRSPA